MKRRNALHNLLVLNAVLSAAVLATLLWRSDANLENVWLARAGAQVSSATADGTVPPADLEETNQGIVSSQSQRRIMIEHLARISTKLDDINRQLAAGIPVKNPETKPDPTAVPPVPPGAREARPARP